MWRIIRFIFTGSWHEHTWIEVDTYEVQSPHSDGVRRTTGKTYIMRCKTCGNMTDYTTRV